MDAYKALCEKTILDLEPGHPMPVMPYHFGQSNGNDAAGTAGLKKQLAAKEQDLFYTKRENERLTRELENTA